ncbi:MULTISPECIES: fimbrial protein [unclassified Serratia (in: enterobacteria)]|uniref:fimbrial protein n=1 Tax=unclassified Serratia (in: enterobacteria) TaxID=2647522 RepID=UPI000506D334|nr:MULTISPECIES: fimbrial protein [unclassified Serratia (in: enterobacteria)]KFK94090.1 ferrous iron transporter B [Serratia sp. Ag2]KFL00573.1 ferrous iron transporter B [Serratia sp. Ag1]
MKKNIIVATLVAAAAMTTASTFAADGQVNFSGSVIDASCNVTNATSGSLNVVLGQVSKSAFTAAGTKAAPTKFTLQVSNCPDSVSSVGVKFDGTTVAGDNSVLALTQGTGVATGVGIQLSDASQNVLPLNTASINYPLTAGAANLDFVARYISTAATVTAGPANAIANFSIIYN